jgi:hypothetical protein
MTPLRGAITGAQNFSRWAKKQGCDTLLLVDRAESKVGASDIFDAVKEYVDAGTYEQLIVYFSGHGILQAPGVEYWLLSRAPENPNEAVNLFRSIEDARNSGIPHVVFVSDACRSIATGPPLSGVIGSAIFPNNPPRQQRSEIDVFYATRPYESAYEIAEADPAKRYKGIFTDSLLKAVNVPKPEWVEAVEDGSTRLSVVTARRLKPHLETTVPEEASAVSVTLRQEPEVRVESALPKFFAVVEAKAAPGRRAAPPAPTGTTEAALTALSPPSLGELTVKRRQDAALADDLGLTAAVERLAETRGRAAFETRTGFTVFGASKARADAHRWSARVFREGGTPDSPLHVRLDPLGTRPWQQPSSIVFEFDRATGTVLPVLPGFIGTIIVEDGRVTSVDYVPSRGTPRYRNYEQQANELEEMKAFAAVASRNGRFAIEDVEAPKLAKKIRQAKGIDPTMGLYAAYAYAQVGRYEDVYSVYRYMGRDVVEIPNPFRDEIRAPIPFDVALLATRFRPDVYRDSKARVAPFAPMLSQGWALLMPDDAMHQPIHRKLRRYLVASLWTTLDVKGVRIARGAVRSGQVE